MLRLPPLSQWLDTTGTSVQEDEFFLKKENNIKLYAPPPRRPGDTKYDAVNEEKKRNEKFGEPIEQLSPKGIALLLHILAEKNGESQPLIVSTIADFKYLINLIEAAPSGTQVTVIFQPTEGSMLFPAVHKTVLKIEKADSKLNVIHMDSTGNEVYFGMCERWMKQDRTTNIDFYQAQDFEDPRGYLFHALELNLSTPGEAILDHLKSQSISEYQMPLLVKEGVDVWLYGLKMNKDGVPEPTLMKFSKPELFNEIFFTNYVKEARGIPKEIYDAAAELGLHVRTKAPYSRQADLYQCGIFSIKDARQLHRDRDFLKKITSFEDTSRAQPEEKGHYYRFNTPPAYLKGVQSSAFKRKATDQYSDVVVTRKGKTLQETYDKHDLKFGYVAHFSEKYHRQVEKFLEKHKDNPAFIRACVEKYDAGKITLTALVAIYGPQKKQGIVSNASASTTTILSRGVGVGVKEEKKPENRIVPNPDTESTTSPAKPDERQNDNDKIGINNAGKSQVLRK